ncbi:hypothetical protein PGT21_032873 [Puccinia graminis f. sp. tritici]|uniref:HTH TFE/IIEalpha-type domain-containing protein n=1 Tax=Puccinia graminis f. sp. tritici TaxID=56615 RepID=A0A5B0LMP4_PUCGR|nr:hypothetical protein PGTUg99_006315 [Puccinia graminis f. sp. tritici]KAA1094922.1 hypothetical protein PGT21_032873 [Puccinia graminis f. sp. tritici]
MTMPSSAASSPSLQPGFSSGNSTSPTSPEDQPDPLADLRLLLQFVARAFYEVRHILLFDQLIRKEAMKDEELSARLGMTPKDLAKAANPLIRDQLVSTYMRAEQKPGAYKATQRTYYFIDYKHCVDVIKWRMWKMNKVLDDKQRNVIDGQGYVCPRCKKTYSTLDISGLSMTATSFLCEICGTPLNDNENDIEVQKNKDRMQRLNSQTMTIKKNLQKADQIVIPPFDIAKWVAVNVPLENQVDSSDGLAVATGGAKEAAVTVQLAEEGDLEAKKRLKEQQAEAKRQANALPVWIAQSTVSGELTRAGMKDGPMMSNVQQSSGVSFHDPSAVVQSQSSENQIDDIDYDAYFAKLQTQTGSTACSSTGSNDSKRSPADSSAGSLPSPTHSRDSPIATGLKRPRAADQSNSYYGSQSHNERASKKSRPGMPLTGADRTPPEHPPSVDVRMVMVAGKPIPLLEVTDDHEQLMSSEEYTQYAQLVLQDE